MDDDPDGGPRPYDQERAEAQWDHEVCMERWWEAISMPLPAPDPHPTASEARAKNEVAINHLRDQVWRLFPFRRTQGEWNRRASQVLGRLFLTWEVPKSGDVSETIRSLRRAGRR